MRTIDVDHFLKTLKGVVEKNGSEEWRKIANTMAYMIETESTLCGKDIVMCGDCKHYDTHDHRCKWWNHGIVVMGYCSRGEKK